MIRLVLITCLLGVCWGNDLSVQAEDKEPQLRLMQTGGTRLIQDLESVMSLTSSQEQKETANLKETLNASLVGMSMDRLMRMDVLFGDGPVRYRPSFPIANEREFWNDNLIKNGIQKGRRGSNSLFSLKGAYEGYMRIRDGYAMFGEKRSDLPLNAKAPDQEIAHLAKLTDNAAIELINAPDGLAERKKSFNNPEHGLRQELLKELLKTKSESQDAFDVRELAFKHQLAELERLYVETEYSLLVAKFDPVKKTSTMDLDFRPIAKTALEESILALNQSPLSFANVPKSAKSNLSLRMKFPLDEMRQTHFTETFTLLTKIAHKEADKSETKNAAQKSATHEVIDLGQKLLLANVKKGIMDGFFEAHPNPDGTNTAISAFKAADGNAPLAILKLLEKTRDDQQVKFDLAQEQGVKIHSFLISEQQHPGFKDFYGSYDVFVGTSADAIWLGAGPKALEEMQAAIREVAKPNTGKAGDPFFSLSGRAAPWMELHLKARPDSGGENFQKYRRLMIEAGEPGDDQFDGWLNRKSPDNSEILGKWTGEPGWMRFVGKYLADFSYRTLQE